MSKERQFSLWPAVSLSCRDAETPKDHYYSPETLYNGFRPIQTYLSRQNFAGSRLRITYKGKYVFKLALLASFWAWSINC